jgi:hypothetical protein
MKPRDHPMPITTTTNITNSTKPSLNRGVSHPPKQSGTHELA